jgi:hypothetical protein
MACAHVVNGTVSIFKSLRPQVKIFVDASLTGLGGALGKYVYELAITHKPDYCIAHWEAINILVALRIFSSFVQGQQVQIWCDNSAAVNILNSGRGSDPLLQCIARNLWLCQAQLDCNLWYSHIKGQDNCVADLLSRWSVTRDPVAKLFKFMNQVPVWMPVDSQVLFLDHNIQACFFVFFQTFQVNWEPLRIGSRLD